MQLVSKISNLCDHKSPTSQTDRRHAMARPRFALCIVHRAVKITIDCRVPVKSYTRYRVLPKYMTLSDLKARFCDVWIICVYLLFLYYCFFFSFFRHYFMYAFVTHNYKIFEFIWSVHPGYNWRWYTITKILGLFARFRRSYYRRSGRSGCYSSLLHYGCPLFAGYKVRTARRLNGFPPISYVRSTGALPF